MRIGLNLLHANPEIGGGWNYIKNLLSLLGECDQQNEYVAYCTNASKCLVPREGNFRLAYLHLPFRNRFIRIAYENTILQLRALLDGIDVMYWFANTSAIINSTKNVVTVHDLLPFADPQAYPWLRRAYSRALVPRSIRRATVVAAVSSKTATDVAHRFGVNPKSVVVVPNPLGSRFGRASESDIQSFRSRYRLPGQMWLYVSHCYPHKNHRGLIAAYAAARTKEPGMWPLVLCGNTHGQDVEFRKLISNLGLDGSVIWLKKLSDHEMPKLYSAATAFVFPSLYEGGGIPVMEAMACGCPVAASDIPTTREFGGNAVLRFDARDIEAITNALLKLYGDSYLRGQLRQLGLRASQRLRGDESFAAILNAYQIAAERRFAA